MNKLEILDKIMDIEDKYEAEAMASVPSRVIQEINKLYGDEGSAVARIYYNTVITGKEADDCPECAKKTQELINFMKLSQTLNDALTKLEVEKLYEIISKYDQFETSLKDMVSEWKEALTLDGVAVNENLIRLCLIRWLALQQGTKK